MLALAVLLTSFASDPNLNAALETLRSVGKEGKGAALAAKAWKVAAEAPASEVTTLLAAFDGANPLAVSYLQSAVDAVVEKKKAELSAEHIEAFLKDAKHSAAGRRLAFEILVKLDPRRKQPLLASMLDDPAVDLRRDAVQVLVDKAAAALKASKPEEAKPVFHEVLRHARDQDQIESAASNLRKLGVPIDLSRQFGFLAQWMLIGPFENKNASGWSVAYPPENGIDLAAEYDGKVGKAKWFDAETDDDQGTVDLNALYKTKHKGAVAYALAKFHSDKDQDVEIRLGSLVAWKIWVNGEKLFERYESHAGYSVDQYKIAAKLKKGENAILLKLCQNEQTEPWAQDWMFAARVCDSVGGAILSTARPPAKPSFGKKKEEPAEAKKAGDKQKDEKKK